MAYRCLAGRDTLRAQTACCRILVSGRVSCILSASKADITSSSRSIRLLTDSSTMWLTWVTQYSALTSSRLDCWTDKANSEHWDLKSKTTHLRTTNPINAHTVKHVDCADHGSPSPPPPRVGWGRLQTFRSELVHAEQTSS
jgi:IS5 family transposase